MNNFDTEGLTSMALFDREELLLEKREQLESHRLDLRRRYARARLECLKHPKWEQSLRRRWALETLYELAKQDIRLIDKELEELGL